MTAIVGEDRQAVIGQMTALHEIALGQPKLAIVPGHDRPAVEALDKAGLLQHGFQ
jgi:hypothetical protein